MKINQRKLYFRIDNNFVFVISSCNRYQVEQNMLLFCSVEVLGFFGTISFSSWFLIFVTLIYLYSY